MKSILNRSLICLDLKASNKTDAFKQMVALLYNAGKISNEAQFLADVLAREALDNTCFEDNIAMPHAKSKCVLTPAVVVAICRDGLDYETDDDAQVKLLFMIASPDDTSDAHIHTLTQLTTKLTQPHFIEQLMAQKTADEALALFTTEAVVIKKVDQVNSKGYILGVTGCPVGIAHTYLAAESIEKAATEMGYEVKVETNGSIGVKNNLTDEDIARADAIIVASDKALEHSRFSGKRVIFVGVKEGIRRSKELIEQALVAPIYQSDKKRSKSSNQGSGNIYTYLMNGVSHMIPFVVVGGLMIALSLALGGVPGPGGLAIPAGSLWHKILDVGVVGFQLMIPVLAGYIAYAIADRPGLAPGLIGGWIANNGSFYGASAGTGFIGAIIAGLLVGYFVRWLTSFNYPKMIQPLVPIVIVPVFGTLFIATVFIFIIGAPIASLMVALNHMLSVLSTGNIIIVGIVIGLMQGFDMGGPFGKVAFLFSVGLIATGQTQFMGAQAAAIPVAPLGMALASFIGHKWDLFTEEEYENGKAALAMGCVGISEGAIPFAAKDPLTVIPANMIGSAVACVLGFLFGLTCNIAHGGPIIVLLGGFNKPVMALIAMIVGSVTTAVVALALKSYRMKRQNNAVTFA